MPNRRKGYYMNNIDWKRKLTSRKLWISIAGFVTGIIVAFGGSDETANTVSGCIMSGAAVIAYAIGEGLADGGNKTYEEENNYERKN